MRYKNINAIFNKTIDLVSYTYKEDELGQLIPDQTIYRTVYAAKKSVPQNEFFLCGQNGIKPSAMFLIRTAEYKGESEIRYPSDNSGNIYTIYRVYDTAGECTELYCEVRAGG
jgi:SPP1 family predicted phage head-tail adaptor